MDKSEISKFILNKEKREGERKKRYWENVGKAYLDSEGLGDKWCEFVEVLVNENLTTLLDETLQIISMIKSNMPYEVIAQTLDQLPGKQTILDSYLGAFIHPEILYEIESRMITKEL